MGKMIRDITRLEWAKYEWYDVTPFGSTERHFMRGVERLPGDVLSAAIEWDEWYEFVGQYEGVPGLQDEQR